jgi:signal transduction histidine kinase
VVVELFDVRAVVMEAAESERPNAAEKGLTISTSVPAGQVTARADRDAIFRIVSQLLHNAVKFTEDGSIHVSVASDDDAVTLRVTDTGAGFDRDTATQLFSPFFQASHGSRRKYRGIGLGLTVVEQLVRRIGGTVEAEGVPGAGATFTIVFPHRTALGKAA